MRLMRAWLARFAGLFHQEQRDRELAAELETHLQMHVDDNLRAGMTPEEARRRALIKLGGVEQTKELYRDRSGIPWVETLIQDLCFGLRMLRKNPGFTAVAVLTLALGVGATTAVFSVVNTVLLKPLPVSDSDHLVMLMTTGVSGTGRSISDSVSSPTKFEHWRAQSSVIQYVSAFLPGAMNYTGGEVVEQLRSMRASADFFRCWGIRIVRGRTFTPEEDIPRGPRLALISEGLWIRRFAGDPQIVGKTLSLNGEPYSVIGIVADSPGLREFGPAPEVYVPFQLDPDSTDEGNYFGVVARLKPAITLEQANARLVASLSDYRARFPNSLGEKDGFTATPLREALVGNIRPLLLMLLSAVGLVLLMACANVASLLLARATGRWREIAIRAAVGGGRGRLIRQLLTESVLLSLMGGPLGLFLGYIGIRALLAVNTADLPLVGQNGSAVNMDWRVTGFALTVSLVTGIVFGLFPAVQCSRVDLNSALNGKSGRFGLGLPPNKARAVLVVSETSLAVILLVGSVLLIRSFAALYGVDRGLETKNVVTMRTSLTGPKYSKSLGAAEAIRSGLEHLRSIPGVVAASATCCVPLKEAFGLPFEIVGHTPRDGPEPRDVGGAWSVVSPGYFEVFKIPVKRGRTFTDTDDDKSPSVVVINERLAKKYWNGGRDPLQDRIVIGRGLAMKEFKDEPARQIIGIVGDVRNAGLNPDPMVDLVMYVPQEQLSDAENAWVLRYVPLAWAVRTQPEPYRLLPVIREHLQQATGLAVSDVLTMDEVVSLRTSKQRFNMLLMTVFGFAAMLLAAIGIYGLLSYGLSQRTHEIGVRMALGAQRSDVLQMIVGDALRLAVIGIGIGIGGALALTRFLSSLLFGVKPADPLTFSVVAAALFGVALVACYVPARRATKVDPMVALRYE